MAGDVFPGCGHGLAGVCGQGQLMSVSVHVLMLTVGPVKSGPLYRACWIVKED